MSLESQQRFLVYEMIVWFLVYLQNNGLQQIILAVELQNSIKPPWGEHYLLSLLPCATNLLPKTCHFFRRQTVIEIYTNGIPAMNPERLIQMLWSWIDSSVSSFWHHKEKKQGSWRSLDVTVKPKITSELGVSSYTEIARWLKPVTGTS